MQEDVAYGPRKGVAAEWSFHPSAKTKRSYPDASDDDIAMDLQDGEYLSLVPITQRERGGHLSLKIAEGTIELIEFERDWILLVSVDNSAIKWDASRIVAAWASE